MGHYDSAYEHDEDQARQLAVETDMKHRRKMLDKFDEFFPIKLHRDTPKRFVWAFEDYRRWLNEGLDEWERNQTWTNLKKK